MRKKSEDLSGLLKRWSYDPARTIRRIQTASGREVLQVRLPLGIEQYELRGRPDGKRPEGCESWLHYYQKKRRALESEFLLEKKDCEKLSAEAMLYYYRYLLFFQTGEYALCARDTARNLRLLEFVARHASKPEHCETLEQYRPYILRMNIMARTLRRLEQKKDLRAAVRSLRIGIEAVRSLPSLDGNQVFDFERDRSIKSLEDLSRQLERQLPVSRFDVLKKEMEEAISREDYEKAATIRDQIRKISE